MRKVQINTIGIGANITNIPSKGCFKIKVRNDSTGTILVNGYPIDGGTSEIFNDLPPGDVFVADFDLDQSDVRNTSPLIYVTRYFYCE